jgi:hypothetical protein
MILMGANPLLGPMEGVGPENLGISASTPSNGPSNGFARIKIITSRSI